MTEFPLERMGKSAFLRLRRASPSRRRTSMQNHRPVRPSFSGKMTGSKEVCGMPVMQVRKAAGMSCCYGPSTIAYCGCFCLAKQLNCHKQENQEETQ